MPVCFIITPIGPADSEIRRNADDLRDLIIKPVLESAGFTVLRGDHRSEAGQIDIDVIRAVQESDLCIVDLSLPNPNVYYEFGRRDETGKPLILLKAKGSEDLPVDVATRRYIEYDLDSRRGLIDAREQLKNFVEPIVKNGFETNGNGASLLELSEILRRVERKIDRLEKNGDTGRFDNRDIAPEIAKNPVETFKIALRERNIPLAEQAMEMLGYRMDHYRWLDQIVEQVAAIGSRKAGDILIRDAFEFVDNTKSFKDKIDYLGCLVSNLNRTVREMENLQLVKSLCESLKAISDGEELHQRIQIHNQLNRLYHGIYGSTRERKWLELAIQELEVALSMKDDEGFIHYNLAMCLKNRDDAGDMEKALNHVLTCIELDGDEKDDDHIEMACELLHRFNDERFYDYLDMLESVNPIKARLLKATLK